MEDKIDEPKLTYEKNPFSDDEDSVWVKIYTPSSNLITLHQAILRLDTAAALLRETHPAAANSIDNFINRYKDENE